MNRENEKIKKRLQYEDYLVEKADANLKNEMIQDDAFNLHLRETQESLAYILNEMGLKSEQRGKVDNISDLLEMMLTPLGVMYEKCDISGNNWKQFHETALVFSEDGRPLIMENSLTGKKCTRLANGNSCRMSKRLKLLPEGYKLYRPVVTEKFDLKTIIGYYLKVIPIRSIILVLLMSLALTLLGLVAPKINQFVLGDYVAQGNAVSNMIIGAMIAFFTAGLMTALITFVKNAGFSTMTQKAGRTMETAIMAKVLDMPLPFFHEESSGRISTYVTNARQLGEMVVDLLFGTSISAVFSLIYIPQMMSFAPSLVLPALIILGIELILSIMASVLYARNQREGMELEIKMKNLIFMTMKGIQKIKEAGANKRAYVKWADIYRRRLDCNHNPPVLVKLKPMILSIIPAAGTIILLGMTGISNITGAEYIAFNSSYGLVCAAVIQLALLCDSVISLSPNIDQIAPLFAYQVDENRDTMYIKEIKGHIIFDHVGFAYAPNSGFEFSNFNYTIEEGQRIGIVGPSGCGKSTLINMLMGLNLPSSGTIYLDHHNQKKLNMRVINRKIGFVAQYSKLLPGTIRYNISLGVDEISDEDIWKALDMVAIGDYVRTLESGLDTDISETNSGGFSGGQKQCLMLARAFAKKPKLLILDEATSALDERTQKIVLDSIYSMNCTLLMVAHRLTTIESCDRILMFENGHVVEEGTYQDLIDANGKFAEFARLSEGKA